MDWKDILIRTGKTFVQSFGGVFIPALVTYLGGGFPESLDAAWVVMAPTFAAAMSAAICAAWNALSQAME